MDVPREKYAMKMRNFAKVKKHWWSRCQAVRVDADYCCRMSKEVDLGTVKELKTVCQYVGELTAVVLERMRMGWDPRDWEPGSRSSLYYS